MEFIESISNQINQRLEDLDLIPLLLSKWEQEAESKIWTIKNQNTHRLDCLLAISISRKRTLHRLKKALHQYGSYHDMGESLLLQEISRISNEAKEARRHYYVEKMKDVNHSIDCECRGCNAIYGRISTRNCWREI